MDPIQYKGYTIERDFRNPYSNKPEYMFYPTEEGINHDYDNDGDDQWYDGNCKWADSIEEAKDEISEKVFLNQYPERWIVRHSNSLQSATFEYLTDALRFSILWNVPFDYFKSI